MYGEVQCPHGCHGPVEHKNLCLRCKKPTDNLDLDFEGYLHPRCSWLWFYNGVIKPKGFGAWLLVFLVWSKLKKAPFMK